LVKQEIEKYKNARICYSQEEHKNGGAYDFVKARLQTILLKLNDSRVNQLTNCYAGRPTAASTATGSKAMHLKELKNLMDNAMNVDN